MGKTFYWSQLNTVAISEAQIHNLNHIGGCETNTRLHTLLCASAHVTIHVNMQVWVWVQASLVSFRACMIMWDGRQLKAELELVSARRQMERGLEDFYQTHMNVGWVGGVGAFMFPQDGNSHTHTQAEKKMQTSRGTRKCVHFKEVRQTQKEPTDSRWINREENEWCWSPERACKM